MGLGLGQIASAVGRVSSSNTPMADVIEFISEAAWGLNIRLFPVQRVILKAHYGLELDDKTRFKVAKNWRLTSFWEFTEKEYLAYLHDEGRCNIREVDHERREMILALGRRAGKCVLGDTLVPTDRGIYRIEELGDPDGPEVQALCAEVAQEAAARAHSAFFYNGGVQPTRTLTTRCGYRLGGTHNHRIKVLAEDGAVAWRHLADLKVGDVACIHRGAGLWASGYVDCRPYHNDRGRKRLVLPEHLTEDWGRLLGYLVGDGLWNYKGRVEVTVEHHETWRELKGLFGRLLGGYSVVMDKRTKNTGAIKFSSVGMRQFLHDLGFRLGTDKDAKMVPWAIMRSPCSVVEAFLRALFEADGGVESKGKAVTFSTASARLAREVQTLLLNLGIVSRIRPKTVKGGVYWVLIIRGLRSRQVFAERVGFEALKKTRPLWKALRRASREGGNTESIPFQRPWARRLVKSVRRAKPKQGWSRSRLRGVLGNTIKPGASDEMTYPRLGQALPVARGLGAEPKLVRHFEALQEKDYFFDPVVAIEEGLNPVFDLNVPDGESFVANGFTNHNTFLSAGIATYETYKLILRGSPQGYYGLTPGSQIGIVSVATDKEQAGILYSEAAEHFRACSFFAPYTANNTMSYARFQSPADIERSCRYGDNPKAARVTIKVSFRSCIAKGLRGPGNMIVIMDEFAHFTDGTQQSSAEAVYNAITPSTATFSPKDPADNLIAVGPVEGRIVCISSPLGRQGQFYKLFQLAAKGGEAGGSMLAIAAPTWEVNPTLPASEYAKHYAKDPTVFRTEFGAEFTDRTRGWIERAEDLVECIDPERRPITQAPARRPHFVGFDLGLVGDASAVALGHLEVVEGQTKIVVDLVDQIKAGEGDYVGVERLEFDDVVKWLYRLSRKFFFSDGLFDMWAGIPFEQALAKKGLRQLKAEHLTSNKTSEMFRNFKDMMFDKRLVLYDWPIPEDSAAHHCP